MLEHLAATTGVEVGRKMITTSISGTAFRAVSANIVDRTTKELSEEIILSSDNSKTDKTSNISYQSTQKVENSSLVAFKDPINDKYVILSLKDSTLDKLKSHFGENDFFQRKDGITRLDNKAEAFVGGWFGDIAYKREFLKADSNNDGLLNESEYNNTKNSFKHSGEVLGHGNEIDKISTWISGQYESSDDKRKNIINQFSNKANVTIDEQLDATINRDKDFNSEISFGEALTSHYKKNLTLSIIQLADDMVGLDIPKNGIPWLEEDLVLKLLKEANEEQLKKLKTLEKLKQNGGDTLQLSKDEKELISTELEKVTNKDSSIDTDKLEKIINSNKTSMIYNEVDSSEMLGKFYEDKG
ncbi:MAG: hypothetical protein AABY36_03605 [Campylobacterota bacterium]